MPAIDEDEEEEFKGERNHDGGHHHHAHGHEGGGDEEVDDEEGDKDEESHLEGGAEFADDKGWGDDIDGDFVDFRGAAAGEAEEELDFAGAGLFEHEAAERSGGTIPGLFGGDGLGHVGLEGVFADALADGCHDKKGEEEGHADEDLVGGGTLDADGTADEPEDDDDAGEARHEHEDGGGQGEEGHDGDDLDRRGHIALLGGSEIDAECWGGGGRGLLGEGLASEKQASEENEED